MLYRCDKADNCKCRVRGFNHDTPHEHRLMCDHPCEYGQSVKCIPVEPERVRPEWCRNDGDLCQHISNGLCRNGRDCCWGRYTGLLQRMGMCEWEAWILVVQRPEGRPEVCNLSGNPDNRYFGTKQDVDTFMGTIAQLYPENRYRAFRWQDGLR